MRPRRKPWRAPPARALILAAHTSRWARALPGVAARLGGRIDTHATRIAEVNGVPAVTRWFYRQRMEAVLTRSQRPWLVLLEAGCFAAWAGRSRQRRGGVRRGGQAPNRAPRSPACARRRPASRPSVPTPSCCSSPAPAGPRSRPTAQTHPEEAEQLILGFLRASQASLGGSKSLVDLSGEGEAVLPFMTPPEPGRPDRRHAAPSQGALHLLPRRRAARGGLALHQRAPRRQPRPQLRMGARQGRRALRGRRLRGDGAGQSAARRRGALAAAGSVRCGPDHQVEAGGVRECPEIPVPGQQRDPAIDTALSDQGVSQTCFPALCQHQCS